MRSCAVRSLTPSVRYGAGADARQSWREPLSHRFNLTSPAVPGKMGSVNTLAPATAACTVGTVSTVGSPAVVPAPTSKLVRYAWLSVAAALVTIALKAAGYWLTDSVGLLSDATESLVNLAAAAVAVLALSAAAKPANARYTYGRSKAEYFSSAVEGAMIFAAAGFIIFSAIDRIIHPQPLAALGWGLGIVALASLVNGIVGIVLLRAGAKHRSPTLRADGKHPLTDVITSVGVIVGVGLVVLTDEPLLDPIVAILVAVNILATGVKLLRESLAGLMDAALSEPDTEKIVAILRSHTRREVRFHGLQTRVAGRESFCNFDLLVPSTWTVREGHELAEDIAEELRAAVPHLRALIHVEPLEDPRSYEDIPEGYVPLGGISDAVPDIVVEALTTRKNDDAATSQK